MQDSCCKAAFPDSESRYDDWVFAPETAQFTVREHFKVASLDGFGLKNRTAAIGAAGAVLHYLTQHLRRDVAHLTSLSFYQRSDFLALDYHDACGIWKFWNRCIMTRRAMRASMAR